MKKPVCVNVMAMDRLIDYLLTSPDNLCGKCAYYREGEEVTCNSACKDCKQGMIAYFAGVKEVQNVSNNNNKQ